MSQAGKRLTGFDLIGQMQIADSSYNKSKFNEIESQRPAVNRRQSQNWNTNFDDLEKLRLALRESIIDPGISYCVHQKTAFD